MLRFIAKSPPIYRIPKYHVSPDYWMIASDVREDRFWIFNQSLERALQTHYNNYLLRNIQLVLMIRDLWRLYDDFFNFLNIFSEKKSKKFYFRSQCILYSTIERHEKYISTQLKAQGARESASKFTSNPFHAMTKIPSAYRALDISNQFANIPRRRRHRRKVITEENPI